MVDGELSLLHGAVVLLLLIAFILHAPAAVSLNAHHAYYIHFLCVKPYVMFVVFFFLKNCSG